MEPASAASPDFVASIYEELRRLARREVAGRATSTLQATVLVHEAWLQLRGEQVPSTLSDGTQSPSAERGRFLDAAAAAMQRILVERARRRRSTSRREELSLDETTRLTEDSFDVLLLDEALEHLARIDPRASQVVRLRFFAGAELTEIAELFEVSARTIKRDWRWARVWLYDWIERRDTTRPPEDGKRGRGHIPGER